MQIEILAIGRARTGPERELYQTYVDRIRWPLALREMEEKRRLPPAEMTVREGALLLDALPRDGAVVALDETGKDISSEQFAMQMGRWRDDGIATVAFIIGGADGLADEVRRRADLLLSLGRQTWPHMLVRAMLAEQPYVAGAQPAYADYIVFGALQWMRCGSPFPALRKDDPVFGYRERLLDLFDGFGRKAYCREELV